MMSVKYRSALLVIMTIILFSAVAHAGSMSIEINANADDLAGIVEYDSQAFGAVLNVGGGIIFSKKDYTLGNLYLNLKDEVFTPALTLGLGFKGVAGQAEVNRKDYDITAIGFSCLGEYDFRKIYTNFPLLIFAEFSGAPSPLSFNDTSAYVDFSTGIRIYLVRTAAIVAGYRAISIDFDNSNGKDTLTDDAFFIGLRLTF